jgi:hypothetical protein
MSNLLRNCRAYTEFTFELGCRLAENPGVLIGVYGLTAGHPCDDCAMKPCTLLSKFQAEDKGFVAPTKQQLAGLKTNAELAAIHGISKRQVSSRRIKGTDELNPE